MPCLPTKQEIIDTYEVRGNLEVMAIRKASRLILPSALYASGTDRQ